MVGVTSGGSPPRSVVPLSGGNISCFLYIRTVHSGRLCDCWLCWVFLMISCWNFNHHFNSDCAGITVTLELLLYAGKWTGADSQIKTFLWLFPGHSRMFGLKTQTFLTGLLLFRNFIKVYWIVTYGRANVSMLIRSTSGHTPKCVCTFL